MGILDIMRKKKSNIDTNAVAHKEHRNNLYQDLLNIAFEGFTCDYIPVEALKEYDREICLKEVNDNYIDQYKDVYNRIKLIDEACKATRETLREIGKSNFEKRKELENEKMRAMLCGSFDKIDSTSYGFQVLSEREFKDMFRSNIEEKIKELNDHPNKYISDTFECLSGWAYFRAAKNMLDASIMLVGIDWEMSRLSKPNYNKRV